MRMSTIVLGCAFVIAATASMTGAPSAPPAASSEAAWRASDPTQLRRARLIRLDDTPRRQQPQGSMSAKETVGSLLLLLTGLGAALTLAGTGIRPEILSEPFAKFASALRPISTN
jgi:hypothetical protein